MGYLEVRLLRLGEGVVIVQLDLLSKDVGLHDVGQGLGERAWGRHARGGRDGRGLRMGGRPEIGDDGRGQDHALHRWGVESRLQQGCCDFDANTC